MDLTTGIVRILRSDGTVAGTGFVVSEQGLIATCAHVVHDRDAQKRGDPLPKRVTVIFEKTNEERNVIVMRKWWRSSDGEDVAILALDSDLPEGVRLISLGPSTDTSDHEIHTFGFPKVGKVTGIRAKGKVLAKVTDDRRPLLQLSSNEITVGFSGAPVWSYTTGYAIGMVTSIAPSDRFGKLQNVAFAIPSETLREVCQDLEFRFASINPFVPLSGKVDRPEFFFDREQELEDIFKILNAGSSVSLVGERAVGKSSLLRVVYREAKNRLKYPRKPIYLDMAAVQDDNDFYDDFCRQVGISTRRGTKLQLALKGLRLLLILDELERMTWEGFTTPLRSQLRSLANGQHEMPLKLVLASTTPLERLFPEKAMEPSPFYNICKQIHVDPWSEETIRGFISARLAPTPVRFAEEEIAQLIKGSRGNPMQLMELCYDAYERHMKL